LSLINKRMMLSP